MGAANAFNLVHSHTTPTGLGRKGRILRYSKTRKEVSVFSYVAIRDWVSLCPPCARCEAVMVHGGGLAPLAAVTPPKYKKGSTPSSPSLNVGTKRQHHFSFRLGEKTRKHCGEVETVSQLRFLYLLYFVRRSLIAIGGGSSAKLTPTHSF